MVANSRGQDKGLQPSALSARNRYCIAQMNCQLVSNVFSAITDLGQQ